MKEDESLRKDLKKLGFLKRDPRSKERKKFGLKKSKKRPNMVKKIVIIFYKKSEETLVFAIKIIL